MRPVGGESPAIDRHRFVEFFGQHFAEQHRPRFFPRLQLEADRITVPYDTYVHPGILSHRPATRYPRPRPRGVGSVDATVAYASPTSPASSSQSTATSSHAPNQPRCPTYGGTKNCSGFAAASTSCAPGAAAHQN